MGGLGRGMMTEASGRGLVASRWRRRDAFCIGSDQIALSGASTSEARALDRTSACMPALARLARARPHGAFRRHGHARLHHLDNVKLALSVHSLLLLCSRSSGRTRR